MQILKPVEIKFRHAVVRILKYLVHRKEVTRPSVDFNHVKVLFLRLQRIGDLLMTVPLFYIMKCHFPNIVIDLLLGESNAGILASEPTIRKQLTYRKRPLAILRLLRKLRQEKYDFLIDPAEESSTTAALFSLVSNARCTVGFEKENDFIYNIKIPLPSQSEYHFVDRTARILTVFGIDPSAEDLRLRYAVLPAHRTFAQEFMNKAGLKDRRKLGINISAGSEARSWGVEKFGALIETVEKQFPSFDVVLLCTPQDIARAETIQRRCPRTVLAPVDFHRFAALIETLDILLTPDTSAVHLAAAFNIPSVVLHVQDKPHMMPWTPYRTRSEAVITHHSDLSALSVEEVLAAIKRLIDTVQL